MVTPGLLFAVSPLLRHCFQELLKPWSNTLLAPCWNKLWWCLSSIRYYEWASLFRYILGYRRKTTRHRLRLLYGTFSWEVSKVYYFLLKLNVDFIAALKSARIVTKLWLSQPYWSWSSVSAMCSWIETQVSLYQRIGSRKTTTSVMDLTNLVISLSLLGGNSERSGKSKKLKTYVSRY